MKKVKEDLLSIYIIINIIFVFLFSFFYVGMKMPYEVFGKAIIVMLFFNIVFSIFLLVKKIKLKEYRIKVYDVLLIGISLLGIVSTVFAYNKKVALFGFYGRYEGLFSILYYLSLTFLSSFVKKEDKKKIISVILVTGIIQSIYAMLQINEVSFVRLAYNRGVIWANGLTNNPNFLGSYMLICLLYGMGLFLEEDNHNIRYGIVISILLIGLLLSNTTSCFLSFIVILICVIVYAVMKKKYEKVLILLIVSIFISVTVYNFDKTSLFNDIVKTKNEAIEIVKGNGNDSFGTKRVLIWKKTMEYVPKYLIHGIGIDNYFYLYDGNPLIINNYYYDKAHNEYLQILVTEGIFSLIFYILFYLSIVLRGLDHTYKNNNFYLFIPVVGYLIQAFFNISVIEVAPIFYIALGLLIDRSDNSNIYSDYIKRVLDIIFSILLLVLLLPLFLIIALLIKVIDKGNIFYKQVRTGIYGNDFKIYKFKTINNKKVTRVGKILRSTSLDEIPQLFNVLKGDMSFVGPRPWIVDYYKLFNKKQKRRVSVRPGITGLAQVSGRNSIDIFKKIEYDLEYVDNISFLLDLKILFRSVKMIFSGNDVIDMDKNIKKELSDLRKSKKK